MKKIASFFIIVTLILIYFFMGKVYAVELNNLTVDVNKTIVRPGEDITLTVNFGQSLGAYTLDIAYDNNIFDYISVEGGTANDTSDKVRVAFYDTTGGTSPRQDMSIKFKAKENITTSNPTELTVIGEGLSNADASVTYDDITTPIVKNVTVEPVYEDYTIDLTYTGDIIVNEEKEMTISYSSSMGRYYEHARLVADASTPDGANVKLIGKDATNGTEQDIIQSGWGDAQGYGIGGKDVSQVLNVMGLFTEIGDYTITLKLIDRDNSDTIIAEKRLNLAAVDSTKIETNEPEPTDNNEEKSEEEPEKTKEIEKTEKPSTLPKTGYNMYVFAIIIIIALIILAFIL